MKWYKMNCKVQLFDTKNRCNICWVAERKTGEKRKILSLKFSFSRRLIIVVLTTFLLFSESKHIKHTNVREYSPGVDAAVIRIRVVFTVNSSI